MKFKKTPYLVLVVILVSVGMSAAYALDITLSAEFIELLGILDMNNNKIVNVGTPVAPSDAATKAYVDSASGSDTLALLQCTTDQVASWNGASWACITLEVPAGNLNMNNNKITNVANPVFPNDAATKAYIDSSSGSDTLALLQCTDNQVPIWNGVVWVCANLDVEGYEVQNVVIATPSVGFYSSLAISANGNPVISYQDDPNGDLKVTHCGNYDCSVGNSISTVDTTDSVGLYTSIAIGTDDNPVISHYDETNDDLKVAHCGNPSCSAGNSKTVVDSTGDVGKYSSITIGTDGNPVISYYDNTNDDLKVAHCVNTSCSVGNATTVDSTGDVGKFASIAIGTDGNPVISYFDQTNRDLKVAHCGNVSCTAGNTISTVDNVSDSGLETSLAIGSDGKPIISYFDQLTGTLKVAHCGNTSCTAGNTITTVDSDGFVGKYTSIAIGVDGKPIISYYDLSVFDLKIIHCGNTNCSDGNTITRVDSDGFVGRFTSIAIGPDNKPVLSYYDDSNLNLKVAHCGSTTVCNYSITVS